MASLLPAHTFAPAAGGSPRARYLQSGIAGVAMRRLRSRVLRLTSARGGAVYACSKRALDIVVSSAALAFTAPLLGLVAVAIKLESKGPVLFSQTRIGKDGQPFTMWKFRSMYADAEARKAALAATSERTGAFKLKSDPRITRVGRLIRKASLDEIPQLFNVLNGTMSLVGPRPPLPDEVAAYSFVERGRLAVKPGITCTWQVSGRADLAFDRQVELDLAYINRPSVLVDLGLLFRTVPAVLTARGAY